MFLIFEFTFVHLRISFISVYFVFLLLPPSRPLFWLTALGSLAWWVPSKRGDSDPYGSPFHLVSEISSSSPLPIPPPTGLPTPPGSRPCFWNPSETPHTRPLFVWDLILLSLGGVREGSKPYHRYHPHPTHPFGFRVPWTSPGGLLYLLPPPRFIPTGP